MSWQGNRDFKTYATGWVFLILQIRQWRKTKETNLCNASQYRLENIDRLHLFKRPSGAALNGSSPRVLRLMPPGSGVEEGAGGAAPNSVNCFGDKSM